MRRVVAMLGFIAFALSAPAVARAQTTVSVEGTVVTITVPIFVAGMVDYGNFRNLETGQRDTPEAVAEKLAAFIEEIWNEGFAKFRYRDCLTFRLDVSIKPGGTRERSSDRHNIHYNNNPGTRSTVWDPEASNHTDDTSSAYTTDLGGEWGPPSGVWAHEVGHLLGLGDDYEDVLDENGKAVGSTPAPGRGGTIMDGGDQIDQALVDRIGKLIEKTGVKIPECWKGTMESDTTSVVPGLTCKQSYTSTIRIAVDKDGVASGDGQAKLGSDTCPTEKVNVPAATTISYLIKGTKDQAGFKLHLEKVAPVPLQGYTGGFPAYVLPKPPTFAVPLVRDGVAEAQFTLKDTSSLELSGGGGASIAKSDVHLEQGKAP